MKISTYIRLICCVLLAMGGTGIVYAGYHSTFGSNILENQNQYNSLPGYKQEDRNFGYSAAVNNLSYSMQSTSTEVFVAGSFSTAASTIVAGTTLMESEGGYLAKLTGGVGGIGGTGGMGDIVVPGLPDDPNSPIGDGWDVILFMMLLAIGYGAVVMNRTKGERTMNEQ